MNKIIDKFIENGIQHPILVCTELPLFVKYNRQHLHQIIFIDTMKTMAKTLLIFKINKFNSMKNTVKFIPLVFPI